MINALLAHPFRAAEMLIPWRIVLMVFIGLIAVCAVFNMFECLSDAFHLLAWISMEKISMLFNLIDPMYITPEVRKF